MTLSNIILFGSLYVSNFSTSLGTSISFVVHFAMSVLLFVRFP